jgi:hypothetical protein
LTSARSASTSKGSSRITFETPSTNARAAGESADGHEHHALGTPPLSVGDVGQV